MQVNENSVYLRASTAAFADMNGQALTAVGGQKASSLTTDSVPPTLVGWAFDLQLQQVKLTFSETVLANSLNPTAFVLQSGPQSSDASTFRAIGSAQKVRRFRSVRRPHKLCAGSVTHITSLLNCSAQQSSVNGNTLSFAFSEGDANDIKIKTGLCTDESDCSLRFTALAVTDMNNNPIAAVLDGAAVALATAADYTADATSPQLVGFDLTMPTGKPPVKLTMTFSETVQLSSLDVSGITLLDTHGNA